MKKECFDVQAVFLYETAPEFDPAQFLAFCRDWVRHFGLPEEFKEVPCPHFAMAGCGLHVTMEMNSIPMPEEALAESLKAPIVKAKKFDFLGAIQSHRAHVTITVGEGELPLPQTERAQMAQAGLIAPVSPDLKLKVLHMIMQGLAAIATPLMVNFCPSGCLLTPTELEKLSGMAFPVPILFRPEPAGPTSNEGESAGRSIVAGKSEIILGATLELEAIPNDMALTSAIDTLTALVEHKHAGQIPLEHGDSFFSDDDRQLWVRHEKSGADAFPRIVVSFAGPDKSPRRDDAPKGMEDFQARIAQLKKNPVAPETANLSAVYKSKAPAQKLSGESTEDLRDRIQSTISIAPEASGNASGKFIGLPMIVAVLGALGVFVLLSDPEGEQLATLNKAQSEVFSLFKNGIAAPSAGVTGVSGSGSTGTGIQILPARER